MSQVLSSELPEIHGIATLRHAIDRIGYLSVKLFITQLSVSAQMQNPYSPPNSVNDTPQRPSSESGLWRDKEHLVVRLDSPVFPDRCIKTDQPCNSRTAFPLTYIPKSKLWLFGAGLIGFWIAKSLFGKSFILELPISQHFIDERKSSRKKSIRFVILSMVVTFLAVVAFIFAMISGVNDTIAMCILTPFLLLPWIAMGTAVYSSIRHKPLVKVITIDPSFAWLAGVNNSYLASLPSWGE